MRKSALELMAPARDIPKGSVPSTFVDPHAALGWQGGEDLPYHCSDPAIPPRLDGQRQDVTWTPPR
jgi:hypothetical protein